MDEKNLAQILASNRTEELGFDVWDRYVIPPRLNIRHWGESKKPRIIIGGRGCGKTMLLRYLSHDSTFSSNRMKIGHSNLGHIGVYWRPDTQFTSLLKERNQDEEIWRASFGHLCALLLAKEILRSIESISNSQLNVIHPEELESLNFSTLSTNSIKLPDGYRELCTFLDNSIYEFETWVNDIDSAKKPVFLPTTVFLKRLIHVISNQLKKLERVVFFAYIDEYENFTRLQQQLVNTWIKHSEPPLIFNVAMKRNGFKTRRTLSEESLVETHDYRTIDLENFTLPSEFNLFAAEILLMRFDNANIPIEEIDTKILRDPNSELERKKKQYYNKILGIARELLPTWSRSSLVSKLFQDTILLERLRQRIAIGLERRGESNITAEYFFMQEVPNAAIVVLPALLARDRLSTRRIVDEFQKYCSGERNGFEQDTDWLHNTFIASYLDLFIPLVRTCPVYSGFETYCRMARGNIRHFLELCHRVFAETYADSRLSKSAEEQAEAACQVAVNLLPEVRSFGHLGNHLHSFVLRLGKLFALSQRRTSQSEPERTHFAIRGGEALISDQSRKLLAEAVKWSVLFEEKESKVKSPSEQQVIDYVLNPIYSPYFQISYRKGRKLLLSNDDFEVLCSGSVEQYNTKLYSQFAKGWKVDQEITPDLLTPWSRDS